MPMTVWQQKQDGRESEKLCVFLLEKALSKLPDGKGEILVIVDLRGFTTENGDVMFLKFLVMFANQLLFYLPTQLIWIPVLVSY